MRYRNIPMKLDQFVNYVNDSKINLIPPFQRGHVWTLPARRKLIANIVQGRPIPAIFLYREASGEKFEYNILDGKQRLESLILFIGNERKSLTIKYLSRYFLEKKYQDAANFYIELDGERRTFKDLNDVAVRELRDYEIPTIEITLDEDNPSALDEIINLFVDINSTGEPVKRFDIVKAMSKDKLLESAFDVIARYEERQKDVVYFPKHNEFTFVLQTLQIVQNLRDRNSKVDRMWELLVELAMFLRTKEHKNPVQILKGFISAGRVTKDKGNPVLARDELTELSKPFSFLRTAYEKHTDLANSRLATNQIHFYTMITAMIAKPDLLTQYSNDELSGKLIKFASVIDGTSPVPPWFSKSIERYKELSLRQTTHVNRRIERQAKFVEIVGAL